ncbi:hypothetical protein GCM10011390_13330 [Aureimonas endophytica]|uniref:O-antigen ligase-like membrane protein n=1 Tax=Aureimonas endophytica TaxID=2027858 RepID=A0A916ZH21_9HYPH|nr:hypothetical protein [Aureimonas endophytica]GGD95912.1 hypothetical protein GCM10011390_13330 [Aureimonas endophytica]
MEFVTTALFWALAIYALLRGGPLLIYLFFFWSAFGSFAVVPTAASGGVSLTALPMMSLLVIVRMLGGWSGIAYTFSAGTRLNHLGLLMLFWLAATVTTMFMPRFFAGQVYVVPMTYDFEPRQPLAPSMQNFTQITYLTISVLCVFAFARLLEQPGGRKVVMRGLFIGAFALIGTGILDIMSIALPIDPLLEGFRTAAYTLRVDDEVMGAKRIVGLMPEASAFGDACLSTMALLYFLRHAIASDRSLERYLWPVIGALFLLSCLSTSSAAYAGIAIFSALAAAEWTWRALAHWRQMRIRRHLARQLLAATGIAALVICLLLFVPSVFTPALNMVDELLFNKTASQSFEERSMWTAISLQSVFDTYGFGVGVGSTRASSSFVAGLSNLGLIGASLYCLFLVYCYFQRAASNDFQGAWILSGLRWAIVPGTIVGWMIGTTPDFGSGRSVVYALMIAIGQGAVRASRPVASKFGAARATA